MSISADLMVSCVGLDCWDAISLMAVIGSTAQPYIRNVPLMDWMRWVPALSRIGRLDGGGVYCTLAPYAGFIQACGACCGCFEGG